MTNYSNYEKGVLQGNPLSPLLFNFYIYDIFNNINNPNPVTLDDQYNFSSLMYADDLILFSTTKVLQKCLDSVYEFSNKWNLQINYSKTKCMTFTEGHQKEKHIFYIDKQILENVNEFKYLGITINKNNCSFSPTPAALTVKDKRALYALKDKISNKLTVELLLKIFDVSIKPILLYGCEIWAPYLNQDIAKWESTPSEQVDTQFIKSILSVNRSTTNVLARGEVGRTSLQSNTLYLSINYIKYLENK